MDNKKYKLLLVEDNELDRKAFKRFIDKSDIPYDYTIANCVSEADKILSSTHFDIIITDHSLGDGTSLDILNMAKDIPVIVVTGAGDEETAINAWKTGASDYLIKDLDRNYLKAIPITVENVIRHKQTEWKLQLLSGAVTSTDDIVYITDMQNRIIFVNRAFCENYGYKEEEIIGKSSSVIWIGKNQNESTRSVFQTQSIGSASEVGFYHKRKDDSVFPVSLSRSIIRDVKGNEVAIVGIARDISERILLEDEYRTTTMNLSKESRFKDEFAITVTEALQKFIAEGDINRAKKIICDYHDISRINADMLTLERSNFDFSKLISQIMESLLPSAEKKNIKLSSSLPEGEFTVSADFDKITRVLTNLIHRAIELSPADSHIEVTIKDTDGKLTVEIQDGSPALEQNRLKKILNHFDWIRENFDTGREDLMLGLQITKAFVELHGGRIWMAASETEKNIFCFTIPKSSAAKNTIEEGIYSVVIQ